MNAEAANSVLAHCPPLARVDTEILGERDPSPHCAQPQPLDIRYGLTPACAIVLIERDDPESGGPKPLGDTDAPKAAIQKDVRQPSGM